MNPLLLLAMARLASAASAPEPSRTALPQSVLAEDDACHVSGQEGQKEGKPECGLSALQRQGQSMASDRTRLGEAAAKASRVHAPSPLFWERLHPAPEDHQHELIFTVKQLNRDKLHNMLLERSTPGSPMFRRWLSREEALAVTRNAPSMAVLHRVLKGHGATSIREVGATFLRARAPVGVWRRLLDARFFVFRRTDAHGHEVMRADSYLLPDSLFGHVDGILKLLQLDESPAPLFHHSMPTRIAPHEELGANITIPEEEKALGAEGCTQWPCPTFEGMSRLLKDAVITPDKLRAAYNMPGVAKAGTPEAKEREATSQLVFSSLEQYWSPSDRQDFQMAFDLPRHSVSELDKGVHSSNERCISSPGSCGEANLDVQYMDAMSPWSNLTLYYMDLSGDRNFDDFVVDLLDMDPMPHVVSISYGQPEIGASSDSVLAFDTTMLKLGVQGGTVVVASGDDGAAGPTVRATGCLLVPVLGLQVSWPASSAYVTAVGATMGVESGSPEVVCSTRGASAAGATKATPGMPMITSGGGFSNIERTPRWQAQHVPAQTRGRGIPDVSLAGHAYAMVVGGRWVTVDGTSASAPAFAGMVSMINAERKASGEPLVGFLNPMLYASAGAFKDITQGDNSCASTGARCCGGYEAAPGWDAASGLGVPDFGKLFAKLSP